MDTDIVEKATQIAVIAHRDQVRKTDGTPYVAHPLAVGRMLERLGFSDVVIAAGIVHDVLEDTTVTEAELKTALGENVVRIVKAVTEDKDAPWEERKRKYIESVRDATIDAKAVCVADHLHNARSFIAYYHTVGPSAWKSFNRGKEKKIRFERTLFSVLKETWEHPLLDAYEESLKHLEALPD